jgi:Domain of unknown function (DUF1830)
MAQILDPLPPDSTERILCCYVNATSKVQIARITNIPNWYFERVVFPGQRLMFETTPEALLEIHTGMMASAILSDKIPCDRLRVNESPAPSVVASQTQVEAAIHQNHKQEKAFKTLEKTTSFTSPVLAAVD